MRNRPVVSTAKVRGWIKKSGISYVDATRRNYPSIAKGVSVWQLSSSVYFRVYGCGEEEKRQEILDRFSKVIAEEGFVVKGNSYDSTFEIVSA